MKYRPSLLMTCCLSLLTVLHAAKVNEKAPDFKLVSSQNITRTLSDYHGDVLFINFWASWCAPCQIELPELDRLASEYETKKFKLIAINVDKDSEQAKKTLERLKMGISGMEFLWDPASTTVSRYDISAMPTSFILDPNGIVRATHSGFHKKDPEKWRQEIDNLLGTTEER